MFLGWSIRWYYLGLVGTMGLVLLLAASRIPNPMTGQALQNNSIGYLTEIVQIAYNNNRNNNCQAKKEDKKNERYIRKKVIVMLLQQHFKLLQSFSCFASIELSSKGAKTKSINAENI
jgi:hypothetical protein